MHRNAGAGIRYRYGNQYVSLILGSFVIRLIVREQRVTFEIHLSGQPMTVVIRQLEVNVPCSPTRITER